MIVAFIMSIVRLLMYVCLLLLSCSTYATEGAHQPFKHINWSFDGVLGKIDRQAAQRGFQVYKEVCSACHGLYNLSYRNLRDIGFSEAEIKEIAKNYTVKDGPDDQGDMFDRPALPSDKFVRPYPNEQAARASNNGVYPPDLSLIVKSRAGGGDYIYSLLVGYSETQPTNFKVNPGLYFNPYFTNLQIAMPPPLSDGQVTYIDGTNATIEQMAKDVTVFLQWAAEPEMEHRKSMGLKVMLFLVVFTVLFYVVKARIWMNVK
jgi:ubiquinol-cytochrome c reductase cytochrome c1 subunit